MKQLPRGTDAAKPWEDVDQVWVVYSVTKGMKPTKLVEVARVKAGTAPAAIVSVTEDRRFAKPGLYVAIPSEIADGVYRVSLAYMVDLQIHS